MATKTTKEHKHLFTDPSAFEPAEEGHYRLFTCILNVGGGIRRPFYAEYRRDLQDPRGPMARFVMRVTPRSLAFQGGDDNDIISYPLLPGDYVVYAQEIVADDYIQI